VQRKFYGAKAYFLHFVPVCKKSFEFLVGVHDKPLIDVEQINEHLYEHVGMLHEVMVLYLE